MALNEGSSKSFELSGYVVIVAVCAGLLAFVKYSFTLSRDAREPPYLYPKVPVIGHIIGLMREGADYFHRLESRYRQPLYTLPVLKGRMYIVSSPEWAQAVHKASKSIQFNTLVAQAMKNLFCMDDNTMKIINDNLNDENGRRTGIMWEIHDMMFSTLAPGRLLDDLNRSILEQLLPDINGLAKEGQTRIKLWYWLRHHFSVASVNAIWGPRNPFQQSSDVEAAFWEFEANAMPLTIMPLPRIFVPKGWKARKKLFDGMEEYVNNEGYKDPDTSQLIKNRVEINMGKYQLSKRMFAWGESSLLFGALLNTIPTAFWLMSWIFEDPQLLEEIRVEVEGCIKSSDTDPNKRTINVTLLRTSCPLFTSAFRETLRLVGSININRYVAEDTSITSNSGESFLLRKDSVVQIASNVIHMRSFWGSDQESFNARRFMSSAEKIRSERSSGKPPDPAAPFRDSNGKVYNSAYRSFGGGTNICPGRHFAQTEVLALASIFVAGFDIENVNGSGKYKMPPYESFKLMLGVVKPGQDVDVNIRRREVYEHVEWAFEL